MKNYLSIIKRIARHPVARAFMFSSLIFLNTFALPAQGIKQNSDALPAEGTSAVFGKIYGITIAAQVNGPSSQQTPLQVACVFEYTEGDIFNSPPALPADQNGMVNLDKALGGLVTDLRKSGKFAGYALETILIVPPPGTIKAKKLLLIGLGDKSKFTPDLMTKVGAIGMREALRLGVSSYSHSSDLKDAGIDSPTGTVIANTLKGAMDAYNTQQYLKNKKASAFTPLVKFTLLTGKAFYAASGEAISATIKGFKK